MEHTAYLCDKPLCLPPLLFRLALRRLLHHLRLRRPIAHHRIIFVELLAGLIHNHPLHAAHLCARLLLPPRAEDARLRRLEALRLAHAALLRLVCRAQERGVLFRGGVVRGAGVRGGDGGKRDVRARVWCIRGLFQRDESEISRQYERMGCTLIFDPSTSFDQTSYFPLCSTASLISIGALPSPTSVLST